MEAAMIIIINILRTQKEKPVWKGRSDKYTRFHELAGIYLHVL